MGGDEKEEKNRFRPVWHGVFLPEERPALLDADPRYFSEPLPPNVKPEEPPSTGFTQVHVSGLPPDCEDAAVAAKLRQALLDGRRRQRQAAEAAIAVAAAAAPVAASSDAAPAPDATALAGIAEEACAEEEDAKPKTEEPPCDATEDAAEDELPKVEEDENPFESCAVVREKDNPAICKGYCFLCFKTLKVAEEAVPLLNNAVEVAGCEIKAQLSKPKGMKVKPPPKSSKPEPEQHDLRIRRQRYQAVGSKASRGTLTTSGKNVDGTDNVTRNSAGRINAVCGTRTGKLPAMEVDKLSTRSGFKSCER